MLWSILLACGDPVEEYTIPTKEESNWKKWENKGQDGPAIGEAVGKPPEDGQANPTTNDDALPPIYNPSDAAEKCRPIASSEPAAPGENGVQISGKIDPASAIQGPLLLEIVRDAQEDTSLYSVVCGIADAFVFLAPPNLTDVYVVAFSDADGNGPSDKDPMGISTKISIGTSDIALEVIHLDGSIEPLSLPFVMADSGEPPPDIQEPIGGEMPAGDEDGLPPPVNRPLQENSDQSADVPPTEPPVESREGAEGVKTDSED